MSALWAKYIQPELNKGMERLRKAQCKRIQPERQSAKSIDYIVSLQKYISDYKGNYFSVTLYLQEFSTCVPAAPVKFSITVNVILLRWSVWMWDEEETAARLCQIRGSNTWCKTGFEGNTVEKLWDFVHRMSWGYRHKFSSVICMGRVAVMNETCLPFWWPCDSHSHAHLQGVSMVAVEHGTVHS